MVLESEPSDRAADTGAGVELNSGVDYAVARSLERKGLGDVEGPGGELCGLYFNNEDGLALRRELRGEPEEADDEDE